MIDVGSAFHVTDAESVERILVTVPVMVAAVHVPLVMEEVGSVAVPDAIVRVMGYGPSALNEHFNP